MLKLLKKDFDKLEKLVVVKGENYNSNRCLVVPINIDKTSLEVTMCMDELDNVATICQINGEDIVASDKLLIARVLSEFRKEAEVKIYSKEDEKKYDWYSDDIKMSTDCCDKHCVDCLNCKKSK